MRSGAFAPSSRLLAIVLALAAWGGCAGAARYDSRAPSNTVAPAGAPSSAPFDTSPPPPRSRSGSEEAPRTGPTEATGPASAAQNEGPGLVPSAPHVLMKPPVPTSMGPELAALGLDAAHLPPIEKLDARALRVVMKLITRSLGARCGDCHEEGDFAAPTPRKRIARHMWNDFVAKLSFADGTALFCDSCHQGRIVQLDRSDKKALSAFMDQSFVAGLSRKDGRPMECETCHVDMTMRFLADWAKR